MIKILNMIFEFLKPVDTSGSGAASIDQGLMTTTASSLDVIKSLFWITVAILASLLISSL